MTALSVGDSEGSKWNSIDAFERRLHSSSADKHIELLEGRVCVVLEVKARKEAFELKN